jgi:hypothetical protein
MFDIVGFAAEARLPLKIDMAAVVGMNAFQEGFVG